MKKKFYVDFFLFNSKYKNTAVANITTAIYDELLQYKDIELRKMGLDYSNKYLYFNIIRPILSFNSNSLILKNPDSMIVPSNCNVIFYDTIPFDNSNGWRKLYFLIQYRLWLRKCKKIFTFSNCIKEKLINIYGNGNISDKIIIISPYIEQEYIAEISYQCNSQRKVEKGNYVLGFGTGEPRKNISRTLKIFQTALSIDPTLKLILYGNNWNKIGYDLVKNEIMRFGLEKNVEHMGRIDINKLITLYRGAKCFIFPSETEGIGLPPFEALACGTKVILSDIPIFKELFSRYKNTYFVSLDNSKDDESVLKQVFSQTIFIDDQKQILNFTLQNTVKSLYENLLEDTRS